MALSYFDDKSRQPGDADLAEALGKTKKYWDEIIAHAAKEYEPLTEEWKYSGVKWGWSMRLIRKKRTILYLTPCKDYYFTGFVLGDRAVEAARQSDLPAPVMEVINSAPKYGEGTGFRLEIRTEEDLESSKILAGIKMAK